MTVEPVSSVLATTGSSLVLTCSSDGVPTPSFQWIQTSPGGGELVRGYQKELVVETVSYQHQGRFYCRAGNTVRGQDRQADSRPVNVTVTGPPQITRFTRQHEKQVETGEEHTNIWGKEKQNWKGPDDSQLLQVRLGMKVVLQDVVMK